MTKQESAISRNSLGDEKDRADRINGSVKGKKVIPIKLNNAFGIQTILDKTWLRLSIRLSGMVVIAGLIQ